MFKWWVSIQEVADVKRAVNRVAWVFFLLSAILIYFAVTGTQTFTLHFSAALFLAGFGVFIYSRLAALAALPVFFCFCLVTSMRSSLEGGVLMGLFEISILNVVIALFIYHSDWSALDSETSKWKYRVRWLGPLFGILAMALTAWTMKGFIDERQGPDSPRHSVTTVERKVDLSGARTFRLQNGNEYRGVVAHEDDELLVLQTAGSEEVILKADLA